MRSPALRSAAAVACLAAGSAAAQPTPETQALRREIEALRADYEARLQALELRLRAAEAAVARQQPGAPGAPPSAVTPVPVTPAPAAGADAAAAAPASAPAAPTAAASEAAPAVAVSAPPAPAAPVSAGRGLDVSMILSGQYQRSQLDPQTWRIRGFPLPPDAEAGPGTRGFSLAETELTLSANVDPYFRGAATFAITPENEVEVEEAYVQTTALGHGLTARAGRFFSGIGYLNSQHAHAWDFVDAPLAYQAMLGSQFADDGLQLAWVAPTERFLEVRAEVGRGRAFPGTDTSRNGAGAFALGAHAGDDVGLSHSWRAGLSYLNARASAQDLVSTDASGTDVATLFSGRTRVWIADAVYRWAPNGDPRQRNFKLQAEYLHSTREGDLAVDPASPAGFRSVQSGWYLQGVYQFRPRWRLGLRLERLDPGSPELGANADLLSIDTGRARKSTLMLEHKPSEFSRIRLQAAQDRARPGGASDLQWWLQYQMSLGAHGAHGF